ncbi:MAG TPA: polysaccharide biosynthesis/export family protein [Myxococcaceae bacterium]|nr:polysaccharide biosynthesis/export family protein [Myxococcaceae bacterium]
MLATGIGRWALGAVLLLVGCSHETKQIPAPADEPYRIGREDVLDVSVWRDPDLSRTVPVRPDGFISLPLVGELKADGKTPRELEAELRQALQPFVQQPKVTVIVREVNAARVFVTGEVAHPGAYPVRGRINVVQAIALAGGFSDFANQGSIMVIRRDGKGLPVNYADLVTEDDKERASVWLMPGDTVVVP